MPDKNVNPKSVLPLECATATERASRNLTVPIEDHYHSDFSQKSHLKWLFCFVGWFLVVRPSDGRQRSSASASRAATSPTVTKDVIRNFTCLPKRLESSL